MERLENVNYMTSCVKKAFRKKKKTRSIKRILRNPQKHAIRIIEFIKLGKLPCMKDRKIRLIQDGKQKKWRTITKASNYEHILHHAVIGLLEKMFTNSSYRYSVASIPKRGDLFGKKHLEHWINAYKGRKLYVLKFDIKKFFDTIDRCILMQKLNSKIKDQQFLKLLFKIVYYDGSETNRGVPIRYYSSQWFANFYLQSLDNFIKQNQHTKYYERYMDDGVILLRNKRKIRKLLEEITCFLKGKLELSIKSNYQIFMLSYKPTKLMIEDGWSKDAHYGRPIDFIGYKFYPWKTTIRKSTLKSAMRSVRRFMRNRSARNAKSLISYLGRLRHADTYKFLLNNIYKYINIESITKIISISDKERLYDISQIRVDNLAEYT